MDLKITRNVKTNDGHVPPPLSPGCCGLAYRFYPMQVETIHSHTYIQLFQRLPMCLTPPTSFSETMCRESDASHRSPCLKTIPRKEGRKEGNILFNDALNTFYLRLYGVRHIVKDHSDSERGNPLPPHRLLFPISSKCFFICIIPQTG